MISIWHGCLCLFSVCWAAPKGNLLICTAAVPCPSICICPCKICVWVCGSVKVIHIQTETYAKEDIRDESTVRERSRQLENVYVDQWELLPKKLQKRDNIGPRLQAYTSLCVCSACRTIVGMITQEGLGESPANLVCGLV